MVKYLQPTGSGDRFRLVILAVFLAILFSLLIARFYQIQIIEGDKWVQTALSQHQSIVAEPFMRGSFYSNTSMLAGHREDEQPFVIDVPKFHLFIDPDTIPDKLKEQMAKELFSLLSFSPTQSSKMFPEFKRKSRCRRIAMWMERAEKEKVLNWWKSFCGREKIARNALYFSTEYQRSYPFGSLLGSVLHTVQHEKDPRTHQSLPTGGLEMAFNNYLVGKRGRRQVLHSPRHSLDTGIVLEEPQNGADVYLTINHYLQAIAETELAKGVKTAGAKGGWAVMMDPNSGEILALAQCPSFDPSRYADYFNDPALQECTRIKAVGDCFEPGSIFKPLVLSICLKANEELRGRSKAPIFAPEEKIATSNGNFPGRSTPLRDGRVHQFLNMNHALQKSSNIYMGRVTQRLIDAMGDAWYRAALDQIFGFGQKTLIELPGENPGLLPTPGKAHPNGKLEWSAPTPYSLGMGHNILVNSIQMVRAYAVLANGGSLVQPHIVRKIVRKSANSAPPEVLLDRTGPHAFEKKRVLAPSVTEAITRGLKFVTKEGGTSKRADLSGYTQAGKSGTSEKIIAGNYSKQHHVSSFIGFAPAKKPRFVLLVAVDDPEKKFIPGVGGQQFGGICATPIFREIAMRSLQYLGVEPDDPFGYPPGDPRRDADKADWAKEVCDLKQLYQNWNEAP